MADDVARLVATLEADISKFTKSMGDAQRIADQRFGQIEKRMQQTESQFTAGFKGLGDLGLGKILSVAAIEEFSRHVITMTAGLVDQAKVLNVNIEQLQTFRELLKDAGGTAEDADTILKRLSATIGGALLEGSKGGPAQDIFAHLGLGPNALQGDTADVLERVAKALLAIRDPAVRARLEVEAFGRSGQEFERVLTDVAAGLGPVTDRLREQNRIVDDGSAERAKKALDDLAAAWSQLERAAAGPLSFVISGLAEMVKLAKELTMFGLPSISRLAGDVGLSSGGTSASAAASSSLSAGGGAPFKTQAQLEEEKKAAEEAAAFMKRLNGELNNFRKQIGEGIGQAFSEAQKAARSAVSQTKDDAADATDQLSVARNQANVDVLQGTEKAFDAERTLALDQTNAQIADIQRRKNAQVTALAEELKNETDFQAARENVETAANADIAAVRLKFLADLAKIEEQQTGAIRDQIQFADQLRSSLTDVGVAASHGFTSFRDAAAQALRQVADLIVQLYVMKPLVTSLFGSQGTTLGGSLGGSGGLFSNLLGSLPSIANGNIGTGLLGLLPGFANGGDVSAGGAIKVGERGPELFVPRVPGTIIPNGSMGGGSTTLNWSITVKGTTDKELLAQVNSGVAQMMSVYDRNLPRRVSQINNDPFLAR